ncbi:aspartate/glutamate racemase family protein [Xenorhabdus griffiniae]|uniref:Aspartate/glutamate racemase family protein n=1 Tax=Xenorhabdus griffiniae TaxID=351672 RepID=A0ABY9XCX7_9GAMM|nr:aspartate/glutamate racemase family protein [Xenorhabdus griffiniae]MBD1229309.1 aspartate/glutamate racemase family protein [Xenorhabdus griffiniae]MBE8587268.1 aspartate/glutamate racemase family protein [Xenorhabdus griffiniae]WMV70776.1 aspartate/glutamate racemase family protein [Xenorhabdus griffiniae]WNH00452.1 aspartate/glutamate racemase family protein [Xenorhabdus griffiniae]
MKTIGMLEGMSWESTVSYYQAVNRGIKDKLKGLHSAKICLFSVDFDEIEKLQHSSRWNEAATLLGAAAKSVEAGGADFLVICTNTMHKVADDIEESISIPILHIADATAEVLIGDGIKKVGLLGTRFTMEEDFYKSRLINKFGIEVIVPDEEQRDLIHRVIYDELCVGNIRPDSRHSYLNIIQDLYSKGAEAVILGCTEIGLLVSRSDTDIPLYDTTAIHAEKAVKMALEN